MRWRAGRTARVAEAWAPGHVTGFFVPDLRASDPRRRGSVGAGILLSRGVRAVALLQRSAVHRIRIAAEAPAPLPISMEVARRVTRGHAGNYHVFLHHELPIGQGLGMSAAGATATALALGELAGVSRFAAFAEAHVADLFGGGGLGGVAALTGGGWEVRRSPGVPPYGEVEHRPFQQPLVLGIRRPPIPTRILLRRTRFLSRVRRAADDDLENLMARPDPNRLLELSQEFTDRLGLSSVGMRRTIDSLRRKGFHAAQAMFGHTIVASPKHRPGVREARRTLAQAGYDVISVRAAESGAFVGEPTAAARPVGSLLRRGLRR